MAAKAATHKYKGALNRPIVAPLEKLFVSADRQGDEVAKLEAEANFLGALHALRETKLDLLFDEMNIDRARDDAWELLAMGLAGRHVPGFQIATAEGPRGPGAPKKWDAVESLELIHAIRSARRSIAEKKGVGFVTVKLRDACRRVLKEEPDRYPARGGGKMTPENLQKRYDEAKKRTSALQVLMYQPKKS